MSPRRAPRACPRPGCPRMQPCPDHGQPAWSGAGRGMPAGWDRTRLRILRRDGHRCRQCGNPAVVVDHIIRPAAVKHHTAAHIMAGGFGIPAAAQGCLRCELEDDTNLQALCQGCSDAKTQAEAREVRARRWKEPRHD